MKELFLIKSMDPVQQLDLFCSHLHTHIPLLVPSTFDTSVLESISIPEEADFAVASSGTSGKPKLYFRTLKSWCGFFAEQNRLFGISPSSRIFIHGSLAFTGNLNIAYQSVCTKSFLYCSSNMRPQVWIHEIIDNKIDTIYMIPDKLIHLAKTGAVFNDIRTVVCGSQFISPEQFKLIKGCFPNAKVILYYGTSETSYISYKILENDFVSESCVGKIFDSVEVKISEHGNILVKSDYCVCTVKGFYDTKDTGFFKDGLLYLSGRSDDQLNIAGQKTNTHEIIKRLHQIPQIEECDITVQEINSRKVIVAHIAGKDIPCTIPEDVFKGLADVFIPRKYVRYEKLPRNESGKICLRLL